MVEAAIAFLVALGGMIGWLWRGTDPAPLQPRSVEVGDGMRLPTHATGAVTTSWWAMVTLMLVQGTAFACLLVAWLYLWLVNGDAMWPPPSQGRPVADLGLAALALYVGGAVAMGVAARLLGPASRSAPSRPGRRWMAGRSGLAASGRRRTPMARPPSRSSPGRPRMSRSRC
jgi:cytochrome c oxidase subunit I+III